MKQFPTNLLTVFSEVLVKITFRDLNAAKKKYFSSFYSVKVLLQLPKVVLVPSNISFRSTVPSLIPAAFNLR